MHIFGNLKLPQTTVLKKIPHWLLFLKVHFAIFLVHFPRPLTYIDHIIMVHKKKSDCEEPQRRFIQVQCKLCYIIHKLKKLISTYTNTLQPVVEEDFNSAQFRVIQDICCWYYSYLNFWLLLNEDMSLHFCLASIHLI